VGPVKLPNVSALSAKMDRTNFLCSLLPNGLFGLSEIYFPFSFLSPPS
jgi:hypothetical protein